MRSARFFNRYRGNLSGAQMSNLILSGLRVTMPGFEQNNVTLMPRRIRSEPLTHCTTTQPLGWLYEPIIPLPRRLRGHFEATMVTDGAGALHPDMRDLVQHRLTGTSAGKRAMTSVESGRL